MTNQNEVRDIIYRGVWSGLGKVYNVNVGDGYTTVIVKPGESIKQRAIEVRAKFARRLSPDR